MKPAVHTSYFWVGGQRHYAPMLVWQLQSGSLRTATLHVGACAALTRPGMASGSESATGSTTGGVGPL